MKTILLPIRAFFSPKREYYHLIREITGFWPHDLYLYELALRHSSMVSSPELSARECNERLEYLGDSVLDAVIADHLFKVYPNRDEGFLTEMRSKIVNRESLNEICRKIRLDRQIQFANARKGQINKSMYGDALEAFIGAVYLDQGFPIARIFILKKLIFPHINLQELEKKIVNYKSRLLEYVQKERREPLVYEVISETGDGRAKVFKVQVRIGEDVIGVGDGTQKKIAEQRASENALLKLGLI